MIWSPQQSRALVAVSHWLKHWKSLGKPFFTLAGYAGTGKTTLARELTSGVVGEIFYASYTGKAAHVLRRTGIENASTIHKLIYLPRFKCCQKLVDLQAKRALLFRCEGKEAELAKVELSIAKEQANLKRLDFTLNQDSPLWRAALVVIDEYSMADEQTGADLLSFGCPILALGDPGQLPPVQGTRFFRDKPDVLLTEIHRQAADNPIIRMSRDVREGRALVPGQYGESRVVRRAKISDQELAPLVRDVDQLLVGLNETRRQFNQYARTVIGRASQHPVVGDKLVCLRNNPRDGLLNGQIWTVQQAAGEDYLRLRLRGEDGELVTCVAHPEHFAGSANHIDPRTRMNANEFDFGYALTVHKCVHPDTLVESDQGLLPIRLLSGRGKVATVGKEGESYGNLIHNPSGRALQVVCEDGYTVTVTPEHRVEVVRSGIPEMVGAETVRLGDWMRVRLGVAFEPTKEVRLPFTPSGDVRCRPVSLPLTVTNDLAEFFGLMVADGSLFKRGVRLVKRHRDVALRFGELLRCLFGITPRSVNAIGATGFEACSVILSDWLSLVGGMSPTNKHIPESVLRSDSSIQAAFLRGLFEDGSVNVKDGLCDHIQFVTEYEEMVKQAQIMLLRLGIISATILRKGLWSLYIYGEQAGFFRDRVGFVSHFKQDRLRVCRTRSIRYRAPLSEELIDLFFPDWRSPERQEVKRCGYTSRDKLKQLGKRDPSLSRVVDALLGWHWVRVKKIVETRCESMCITVTPSHRFLQNGFPHGNSQGSQWDSVLLLDEWRSSNRKQWLYTGITRAAKSITIVQ